MSLLKGPEHQSPQAPEHFLAFVLGWLHMRGERAGIGQNYTRPRWAILSWHVPLPWFLNIMCVLGHFKGLKAQRKSGQPTDGGRILQNIARGGKKNLFLFLFTGEFILEYFPLTRQCSEVFTPTNRKLLWIVVYMEKVFYTVVWHVKDFLHFIWLKCSKFPQ